MNTRRLALDRLPHVQGVSPCVEVHVGPRMVILPKPDGGQWYFTYAGSCAGCQRVLYRCNEALDLNSPAVAEMVAPLHASLGAPVEAFGGHPGSTVLACPHCLASPQCSARIARRLRSLSELLRRREAEPIAGLP